MASIAFKISAKAFVAFVSHPFHKWNGNDQNSLPFGFSQRLVDKKRTGFSPILNVKSLFQLKSDCLRLAFIDWIRGFDKPLDIPDNWAIRLSVGNVDAFVLLRPATKGVALTHTVATGFNPWATSPKHIMSAIGTMHIIWAEPTALFNVFSFYNGLKPVATILFEPMAL